jgi:membrane fusion protein (multidrug efflux system)
VPAPAVTRTASGDATVMLVGPDNKTVARVIKTGALVDNQWLVDSGLQDGERIVVSGIQKLKAGMVVTPRVAVPAAPQKGAAGA